MPLIVDLALAGRLEAISIWRGVQYTLAKGRLLPQSKSALEEIAGGYALYTGPGSPVNRAVGLGRQGPTSEATLEQVEQFYHARGAPSRVDLTPWADPSLQEQLGQRGYTLEGSYNLLACPLPGDAAAASAGPQIQVRLVGVEERSLWLYTVAQGFSEEEPSQEILDLLLPNMHVPTAVCFLAWVEGQPAGGAALLTHQGVAELSSGSTRPAFRRRGALTALIHEMLAAAEEAGCDLAMAMTSPGAASQRVLERAGFRVAYTRAVLVRQVASE